MPGTIPLKTIKTINMTKMLRFYFVVVGDDSGLSILKVKKSDLEDRSQFNQSNVILYKSYSKIIACEFALDLLKEDKRKLVQNINAIKRFSRNKRG